MTMKTKELILLEVRTAEAARAANKRVNELIESILVDPERRGTKLTDAEQQEISDIVDQELQRVGVLAGDWDKQAHLRPFVEIMVVTGEGTSSAQRHFVAFATGPELTSIPLFVDHLHAAAMHEYAADLHLAVENLPKMTQKCSPVRALLDYALKCGEEAIGTSYFMGVDKRTPNKDDRPSAVHIEFRTRHMRIAELMRPDGPALGGNNLTADVFTCNAVRVLP